MKGKHEQGLEVSAGFTVVREEHVVTRTAAGGACTLEKQFLLEKSLWVPLAGVCLTPNMKSNQGTLWNLQPLPSHHVYNHKSDL